MNTFTSRHFFFFFNDTATTEIYTLSLHDALPICVTTAGLDDSWLGKEIMVDDITKLSDSSSEHGFNVSFERSEEHTSELQSRLHLVCRLLLEKKNTKTTKNDIV